MRYNTIDTLKIKYLEENFILRMINFDTIIFNEKNKLMLQITEL